MIIGQLGALVCIAGVLVQQRKATVIASLKKKIILKKEVTNGLSCQFSGSDAVVDELISFVKTGAILKKILSFATLFTFK